MTNVTQDIDVGVNTGALTRALLEKELGQFGTAYGKGQNSRPAAALRCLEAAHKLSDVTPDNAEELYTKFQQSAARARGVEYSAEGSFKVQVSKLKRFLMLGALQGIDGIDVMNRTVDIIEECSRMAENPLKGSAYDNMVNVARKQIAEPKAALTDDEIRQLVTAETEEKTDLDKVIDAYKKTYRLAESLAEHGVDVGYINNATDALAAQIKTMDGDLPAMTKDEQKKAAALKVLKAQGYVVTETGNLMPVQPAMPELVDVEEPGDEEIAA